QQVRIALQSSNLNRSARDVKRSVAMGYVRRQYAARRLGRSVEIWYQRRGVNIFVHLDLCSLVLRLRTAIDWNGRPRHHCLAEDRCRRIVGMPLESRGELNDLLRVQGETGQGIGCPHAR